MSKKNLNNEWRKVASAMYIKPVDSKILGSVELDVTDLEKYISENRDRFEDFDFILKEIFMVKKFLNRNGASVKMLLDHISVIILEKKG